MADTPDISTNPSTQGGVVDPSERPTAFKNPQKVEFRERRWSTHILITDSEGAEHEFIASADSFYTDRDGIWFGTRQEMERFDDDNS